MRISLCQTAAIAAGVYVADLQCSAHNHVGPRTGSETRHTSHLTPQTSNLTPHTSHVTRLTSHVTRHTSHVIPHTSHLTPHTSHVTRHNSHLTCGTGDSRFAYEDDSNSVVFFCTVSSYRVAPPLPLAWCGSCDADVCLLCECDVLLLCIFVS